MTKSLTNKSLLKQWLFSLRMQSRTPLREHLEKINSILLDLRNLDVKIHDEDAALILLISLRSSYENFVEPFVVGKDSQTLEEVNAALHTRELHQKAIGDNGENDSALLVKFEKSKKRKRFNKGNNTRSSVGNGNERSIKTVGKTCYYCKEPSHFRANCPVRKGKSQASIVEEKLKENYNSEKDLALVSSTRSVDLFDDWVLDSRCSFHMSPRRDWFDTYESCNGGTVIVGNNAPCMITGIGSMSLRIADGES